MPAPIADMTHDSRDRDARRCAPCREFSHCYDFGPDDSPACTEACWTPCEPGPCACDCHEDGEPCGTPMRGRLAEQPPGNRPVTVRAPLTHRWATALALLATSALALPPDGQERAMRRGMLVLAGAQANVIAPVDVTTTNLVEWHLHVPDVIASSECAPAGYARVTGVTVYAVDTDADVSTLEVLVSVDDRACRVLLYCATDELARRVQVALLGAQHAGVAGGVWLDGARVRIAAGPDVRQ